jgi:wyosine [tRNA(Phe)-imidazoG37] synthetase (radical SAM superfamily)
VNPEQKIGYNIPVRLLPLQKGIIYGPVNSRRLGVSLGINLSPTKRKVCSFNCVYCQYGTTRSLTMSPARAKLPGVQDVEHALRKALSEVESPRFITFSGNGEPTIHPDFPEIAKVVRKVRDELSPGSEIALLSNSSGLLIPGVSEAIDNLIDLPIMKLDAGDEDTFRAIARPAPGITLERIIQGMRELRRPFAVQSLFVSGKVNNSEGPALKAWIARIGEISPKTVQIYSLDRPFPTKGLMIVPPERLDEIASRTNRETGVEVKAYSVKREKGENPSWS